MAHYDPELVDRLLDELTRLAESAEPDPSPLVDATSARHVLYLLMCRMTERFDVPARLSIDDTNDRLLGGYVAIAAVLNRTFMARGDAADLADDEALERIHLVVDGIDPGLFRRPVSEQHGWLRHFVRRGGLRP